MGKIDWKDIVIVVVIFFVMFFVQMALMLFGSFGTGIFPAVADGVLESMILVNQVVIAILVWAVFFKKSKK